MATGLLLCFAWYYTILAGFFTLYCPVMYLMFIDHRLYRITVDTLFALWELYPVALFQWCFNTKMHVYGDYVNPDESTIIIMNHRTRVDWNYIWIALYHATQNPSETNELDATFENNNISIIFGGKSKIKFVLKDEIKNIPGMGWIMQLNYFLYVKRNWREDQTSLAKFVDYYSHLQRQCRVVIFPEGTDLSNENRKRSEGFALTNNLPQYDYVLHPRTTGFIALCSRMRDKGLASVYDVTVAYDTPAQTEADLLRGIIPTHVYFHFKRYSVEQMPIDGDELKSWLNERWMQKEDSLRKFHKEGNFIDANTDKPPTEQVPRSLHVAKIGFLFWTLVDVFFTYSLLYAAVMQFWVIYHSLLFIFVTWYFGGFHNIQYKLSHSGRISRM